jgi:predicted membrane protein DUF2306
MVAVVNRPSSSRWPLIGLLGAAAVAAVAFWILAAAPYLRLDPAQFGPAYWPRRYGLLTHIAGGTVALLAGPVQLWLGETRSALAWHRKIGTAYLIGVVVGAAAAYYLAVTTPLGWIFGSGLFMLAIAWTITTGMAYVAIRRRAIEQHREWMIRSYVVTLAFVVFRALVAALTIANVGSLGDRLALAAWVCWAVPLLLLEPCLQWKRLRRTTA